jgi:putative two-component system response regulator
MTSTLLEIELRQLQTKVEHRELEQRVKQQFREIAAAQMSALFALAKLADLRDRNTGKHMDRVQAFCGLLATEMSLSPKHSAMITHDYLHNIFQASPLHDIGKVGIPDAILLKPGKLTSEEFTVMKTHTVRGAETLELLLEKHSANSFVRMGIDITRSHHERWDGSGYPDNLADCEIPLSARIVAVADCYDALRSRRSYKRPFSHEVSRDTIIRGAGHHFDPDVVRAFCSVEEAFKQVSRKLTSCSVPAFERLAEADFSHSHP